MTIEITAFFQRTSKLKFLIDENVAPVLLSSKKHNTFFYLSSAGHVMFYKTDDIKPTYVHRFIYETFVEKICNRRIHIHHVDEDKLNNTLTNLCLISLEEHVRMHKKGKGKLNQPYITKLGGKYLVQIPLSSSKRFRKIFNTLEEAITFRDNFNV